MVDGLVIELKSRFDIPPNINVRKKKRRIEDCLYMIYSNTGTLICWSTQARLCIDYVNQEYTQRDNFDLVIDEVGNDDFTIINEDLELVEYNGIVYLVFDIYILNREREMMNSTLKDITKNLKHIGNSFNLDDEEYDSIKDAVKVLEKINKLYKKGKYERYDEKINLELYDY